MRIVVLASIAMGCTFEGQLRSRVEAPEGELEEPTTFTELLPNCDEAEVEVRELQFDAREGCAFSRDGNLDPRNEFLQARAYESRFVPLPQRATLCDLTLASDGEAAAFDDHMVILVDDVVLVSGGSGGALDSFPTVDGLPRYDWELLRGQPFADRFTPYECLGEGTCIVPETEQVGPLDIQVDAATMAQLVDAIQPQTGIEVRIVTFGDDDFGDCAHTELNLSLSVRYVL